MAHPSPSSLPASVAGNIPERTGAPPRGIFAGFSNIERKGPWKVPSTMRALAIMGNIELDLMGAEMPPTMEFELVSLFGNIEIRVPPTIRVEQEGDATIGNFSVVQQTPMTADPNAPVLRISARVFMGSIEITIVDPNKVGVLERIVRRWKLRDTDPD